MNPRLDKTAKQLKEKLNQAIDDIINDIEVNTAFFKEMILASIPLLKTDDKK